MTDHDRVELVFVTHSNFLPVECFRHEATSLMRQWYQTRDQIFLDGPEAERAAKHLKRGTYAANLCTTSLDTCLLTVGWEHVIGMYVREFKPKPRLEKTT